MFRNKIISNLMLIKKALDQEKKETEEMLIIYQKYLQGKSNKAEMKKANLQFKEILKSIGLGFFAILPFAPLTIPFIVSFGKKYNIDILPSSFKNIKG